MAERKGAPLGETVPEPGPQTESAAAEATAAESPRQEAPPAPAEAEALRTKLEAAEAQAAEAKDQWLRALAEVENMRRRAQREREDAVKYAITDFARDIATVADNLRRALASIPQSAMADDEALKSLATGVDLTERQLLAVFEKYAVRRIDPLGEKFDSHFHQAMFEVPNSGKPAGTVVEVVQAGYMLHDRLLRPALVGVAKAEPAAANAGGNGATPPGGRVDTVA